MPKFESDDFVFELLLEEIDGNEAHTVVVRAPAGTRWSFAAYWMNPSGPTMTFGTQSLNIDHTGVARMRGLGLWKNGLYLARVSGAGTAPSIPQLGDPKTASPFWVGAETPLDLHQAVSEAINAQAAYRDSEIRARDFSGNRRVVVHALIQGCSLDYQQIFRGGLLSPLQHRLEPDGIIEAVQKLLPATVRFSDTTNLRTTYAQEHPLCLVTFQNVQAPNHAEAVAAVQTPLLRILGGMAEDRSAAPEPIAFLSESGGNFQMSVPHGIYRGNLIAGFGPGITGLLDWVDVAAQRDPWIDFAINLMRSIRVQSSPETQLFMAWSLVEAAAKRRVASAKVAVRDDTGSTLPGKGGKPITQETDIGRVLIYLRDHVGRNLLGLHAGSAVDFYGQVRLAYRCRNQIAHGGGINAPGSQPISDFSYDLVRNVRDWASETIRHEIRSNAH